MLGLEPGVVGASRVRRVYKLGECLCHSLNLYTDLYIFLTLWKFTRGDNVRQEKLEESAMAGVWSGIRGQNATEGDR